MLDLSDKYEGDNKNSSRACNSPTRLITDITLDQTEFVKLGGKLYAPICDIRCKTSNGELIIIEMQFSKDKHFFQRMQYYWARALVEKVEVGKKSWPHVYLLAICLNSQTGVQGDKKSYAQTVLPRTRSMGQGISNNLMHLRIYNLDRFSKVHPNIQFNNDQSTIKHQWLHFLKNCSSQSAVPTDVLPEIREAFELMRHGNNELDAATLKRQKEEHEKQEEREKGEANGFNKGKDEGIKIGHENALRKLKRINLENVKEFIGMNWETEKIKHVYTEFETEEIDAVRNHLKDHSSCSIDELAEALRKLK